MRLPIKAVIGLSALLIIGLIGLLVSVAGQTNSSKQELVESGEVRISSPALPTYSPPPTSSSKVVTKEVADEKPADLIKEISATPTPNPTSTPTAVAIPVKTKPSNQVSGDDTAPVMGDFSFNPTSIDTTKDSTVVITLALTDDGAGVCLAVCSDGSSMTQLRFKNIGSTQMKDATFNLKSGTLKGGIFEAVLEFPEGSAGGIWKVTSVLLADDLGNRQYIDGKELESLGFSVDLLNAE